MNAQKDKVHRENVQKSVDFRTLKLFAIGQAQGVISQKTETTEETWQGLSLADALSLVVASVSSVKEGTTRDYLGGISVRIGGGGIYSTAECDECWGTRVTSSMRRMGDTNLYEVQRTTEVMTAYGHGGTVTYL